MYGEAVKHRKCIAASLTTNYYTIEDGEEVVSVCMLHLAGSIPRLRAHNLGDESTNPQLDYITLMPAQQGLH